MTDSRFDVIVVGAGNAALCAALSAHEAGARVLVLEKAPLDERGGNSLFTAGGFRFVHDGIDDLRKDVLVDLPPAEVERIAMPKLSRQTYLDDLMRVTEGETDEGLAEILIAARGRPWCGCARTACASSRCSAASPTWSTASTTSTAA